MNTGELMGLGLSSKTIARAGASRFVISMSTYCALILASESLIAFNAYMLLLAHASAGLASSYTFVNPVIAMLLGVAVGGEVVTSFEWMAAGVVLLGVVLMLSGQRRGE